METKEFLKCIDDTLVAQAITEVESRTSGEIRVFVSKRPAIDPLDEARHQFDHLGMRATRERNAVLIFLAPVTQTFAIYADQGIYAKLGPTPFTQIADTMSSHFRVGNLTKGMTTAIHALGTLLSTHFPAVPTDNPNELPNTVERG